MKLWERKYCSSSHLVAGCSAGEWLLIEQRSANSIRMRAAGNGDRPDNIVHNPMTGLRKVHGVKLQEESRSIRHTCTLERRRGVTKINSLGFKKLQYHTL